MRRTPLLLALLVVTLPLTSPPRAIAAAGMDGDPQAAEPQAAPDFSLTPYTHDRDVSLSDVRGNVVLLYFFFPT
jgi:cytochrome oxidase Cu insertion factor (SCO1/SenC/PrrC family)